MRTKLLLISSLSVSVGSMFGMMRVGRQKIEDECKQGSFIVSMKEEFRLLDLEIGLADLSFQHKMEVQVDTELESARTKCKNIVRRSFRKKKKVDAAEEFRCASVPRSRAPEMKALTLAPVIADWCIRFANGTVDRRRLDAWNRDVLRNESKYKNMRTSTAQAMSTLHVLFPQAKIGVVFAKNYLGQTSVLMLCTKYGRIEVRVKDINNERAKILNS